MKERQQKYYMKKRKKESKTLYSCETDWDWEIGEASDLEGKMPLYSSIEELKENRSCWDSCGIVELEITFKKVAHLGKRTYEKI